MSFLLFPKKSKTISKKNKFLSLYSKDIIVLICTTNLFLTKVRIMLFFSKEIGQGLVEYALILALVAIIVFAVLMILGPIIGGVFSTINDSLSGV